MPFEIIQVTAAYSNAVLVAIMPHVSDFAKALDLPIPQPITVAQVSRFGCSPRADHVGGRVILTNDYSFTFDLGAVVLYRSPSSYYSLQDPNRLSEFYGPVRVKKDEAINIAHKALKKLGYTDSELHLDLIPKLTPPKRNEGKMITRYLVEWVAPDQVTTGGIALERTAVEVDASTGRIEMLGIQNKEARRPDPKLNVHPTVLVSQPKSEPIGGTKVYRVSEAYSHAFLVAIIPQLSAYVEKAAVDVKAPITTNDIDMAHYDCGFVEGSPRACIYLKAGDRFWYEHGQVTDFDAHDAFRRPQPNTLFDEKPTAKFYGPVKISAEEALSVVRRAMSQLGYASLIPQLKKQPEIVPPRKEGTNYFARYFFNWWPSGEGIQIAAAEVDATTKELKSIYINGRASPKIWREPPKIDVAPMIETNAPSPKAGQPAAASPLPSLPPSTPLK